MKIEVSGKVCFGTPEALMIKSGISQLPASRAKRPAIAPILSTSILETLLSFTPDFFFIHSADLSIIFASSSDF